MAPPTRCVTPIATAAFPSGFGRRISTPEVFSSTFAASLGPFSAQRRNPVNVSPALTSTGAAR